MICKLCNMTVIKCDVSECEYQEECKLFKGEINEDTNNCETIQ
jgi:hypothetical protein